MGVLSMKRDFQENDIEIVKKRCYIHVHTHTYTQIYIHMYVYIHPSKKIKNPIKKLIALKIEMAYL